MPARLTDEEIEREVEHVGMLPPEHPVYKRLARRIEKLVAERERAECLDWIASEARDCGCSERIKKAILRDDGADGEGGERERHQGDSAGCG